MTVVRPGSAFPVFEITERNILPSILAAYPDECDKIVVGTAQNIEAGIKAGMAEPKTGREYPRGDRWHVASAPGEYPAIDYGNLVNSIQLSDLVDHWIWVYTNAEYAAPLEYGTARRDGSPAMLPRPSFTPEAEKHRQPMVDQFRKLEERIA